MDTACSQYKSTVSCNSCSISQLCLPFALNQNELNKLDEIIKRKQPFQKGNTLFESGSPFRSLYAVRSGSFKSYTLSNQGEEQVTGFHLPGDIIGFDGINTEKHPSYAVALETSMVCEIPFDTMDALSASVPKLRQQVMRLMSSEISADQALMLLLNKKTAEQKLAAFISSLSHRFHQRGFSATSFRLAMTRTDIANYLGLTIETISRLMSRFQKSNLIEMEGKFISVINLTELEKVTEKTG